MSVFGGHLRSCNHTFPSAWWGSGSSGLYGFFGFAQQDKQDKPNKLDRPPLNHPSLHGTAIDCHARKSRMNWFRQCVGKQEARSALHGSFGTSCLRERRSLWRTVGLRTQTAMALAHRSTRMDIGDLFSHSRKDDLGSQTCS